jgi:hypothetical protein
LKNLDHISILILINWSRKKDIEDLELWDLLIERIEKDIARN